MMDHPTYRTDLRGPISADSIGIAELLSITPGRVALQPELRIFIDLKWNQPLNVRLSANIRRDNITYRETVIVVNATLEVSVAGRGRFANLTGFGQLTQPYGRNGIEFSGLIDPSLLDWIEKFRKGGPVTLECRLHGIVFRHGSTFDAEGRMLGEASVLDSVFATWQSIEIAASTWIERYLPQFGYAGPRYIEIPALSEQVYGQNATQHLQSALSALHQGQWRAVPTYCLAALDAIAKSYHYNHFGDIPDPREWLGNATEERQKVLSSFRHYLNRWRHDNTEKGGMIETTPPLVYEEAAFIYLTTLFLASLMGKHLPENPAR